MSAEIKLYSPSEQDIIQEKRQTLSPFPIKRDNYDIIPFIKRELDNPARNAPWSEFRYYSDFEFPLMESLQELSNIRENVYGNLDKGGYILGAVFGRGIIMGQMGSNNIPEITPEQMRFTKSQFMQGWKDSLSVATSNDEVMPEFVTKMREGEVYTGLENTTNLKSDPRLLAKFFNFAFKDETSRRLNNLCINEPGLAYVTAKEISEGRDEIISGSFNYGLVDTYEFYKTYFDAVNLEHSS